MGMRAPRVLSALALAVLILVLTASAASAAVKIAKIQYNSPGSDDGSNSSLNAEYVVLANTGSKAISLTNWTLRDAANHVYDFAAFKLGAGKSVTIHTGKGKDTKTNLYWGSGWYIWNNDGDTATLKTGKGHTVDTCGYSGGDTSVNC
jgi:hypothetical protein